MTRPSPWPAKVASLIQAGNANAALAQIKVAPSVKDLQQLRKLLDSAGVLQRHADVEQTIRDMVVALSSPRLHRSP